MGQSITESKFKGMIADVMGPNVDPEFRSNLVAGFNKIGNGDNLQPAQPAFNGYIVGVKLRDLLLSLGSQVDDEEVKKRIEQIFSPMLRSRHPQRSSALSFPALRPHDITPGRTSPTSGHYL